MLVLEEIDEKCVGDERNTNTFHELYNQGISSTVYLHLQTIRNINRQINIFAIPHDCRSISFST